jgi:hypothetical protein
VTISADGTSDGLGVSEINSLSEGQNDERIAQRFVHHREGCGSIFLPLRQIAEIVCPTKGSWISALFRTVVATAIERELVSSDLFTVG